MPKLHNEDVGNSPLKLIRLFYRKNQNQMAEALGLSVSYVSALESGSKKPNLNVFEKYAGFVGMKLSSLIGFCEKVENHDTDNNILSRKAVDMLNWIYR